MVETIPVNYQPTCNVCDRGVLVSKSTYRMSWPVVFIGHLILIPSMLGVIASCLLFFGIFGYTEPQSTTTRGTTELSETLAFDASYRHECIQNVGKNGAQISLSAMEAVCECVLPAVRNDRSLEVTKRATEECAQRWLNGSLGQVDEATRALYAADSSRQPHPEAPNISESGPTPPWINFFRIIGGTFAVIWGIGFFVGGLLGWLLIMKKRVLECSSCSATINAS